MRLFALALLLTAGCHDWSLEHYFDPCGTDGDADGDVDADPEVDADSEMDADPVADADPEVDADPEADADPEVEADQEQDADPDSEPCQFGCAGGSCEAGEWATVCPGMFIMGSPLGEPGHLENETQHIVNITIPFLMQTTEVTQAQYLAVMGENPSSRADCLQCPVEGVSWHLAAQYCNELSSSESLSPCYECSPVGETVECNLASSFSSPQDCTGFRLPTEAEWEYAVRSGTSGPHFGEIEDIAWFVDNSGGQTQVVATRTESQWGLYDMLGNVTEWCDDSYIANLGDATTTDPWTPHSESSSRVMRGGCFIFHATTVRAGWRGSNTLDTAGFDLGFRPVRSLWL